MTLTLEMLAVLENVNVGLIADLHKLRLMTGRIC